MEDYYDDEVPTGLLYKVTLQVRKILRKMQFGRQKQLEYISMLMSMVAEMSALKACKLILDLEEGRNSPEKKITESIMAGITEGGTIADGMKGWFDQDILTLFASAMATEDPTKVINEYQENLQKLQQVKNDFGKKVKTPAFMFVAAMIGTAAFANNILLDFTGFLPVEDWPGLSQSVFNYGMFLSDNAVLLVTLSLGLIIGLQITKHTWSGPERVLFDSKIPLFSIYRLLESMSLLQILSLLIGANQGANQAIKTIRDSGVSPYLGWHLDRMLDNQKEGMSKLSDTVNTGMLDRDLFIRLAALESVDSSSSRVGALSKVANMSFEVAERRLGIIGSFLYVVLTFGFVFHLFFSVAAMGLVSQAMSVAV